MTFTNENFCHDGNHCKGTQMFISSKPCIKYRAMTCDISTSFRVAELVKRKYKD